MTTRFPPLHVDACRGQDPRAVIEETYCRIAARGEDAVWIHLAPLAEVLASLPTDHSLPLFGVPFAVKDNLDVRGWPTTAGCPAYAYIPERDATVVARLRAAGAIPIGKTNMDQFATGLVGTRSPYGIPRCAFDERYISGGSSSGSAVAVAAGLVAFALGTDTAGSGRVPAAFNNLVGLKPTRGLVSTHGLVPACRSLDCVSIFTHTVAEAQIVLAIAEGPDEEDIYSRTAPPAFTLAAPARIGIPMPEQLAFFGDAEAPALFAAAVDRLRALGHALVEINFTPFHDAAKLLYAGPWVAERLAAVGDFLRDHPEALHPVTREIIAAGAGWSAVETFRAQYELARLRGLADRQWARMDALLLPTAATHPTVEAVLAEPLTRNSELGFYTNFVNLLDLCGVAIPAGFRTGGLPFGITLLAPAFHEAAVCALAREFTGEPPVIARPPETIDLAVVGAHLTGQPLNRQLTDRDARLIRTTRTAPGYQLWALANTTPPKPGLVRTPGMTGPGIEVEVWRLSPASFGTFVARVPVPMVIGTVELADGTRCKGFLCEPCALEGSRDITHLGGWRAFLGAEGR